MQRTWNTLALPLSYTLSLLFNNTLRYLLSNLQFLKFICIFKIPFQKMMQTIEQEAKYSSICSHSFQKSLSDQVKLECNNNENLVHVIKQFGKICNRCVNIILKSKKKNKQCIVCSDTLIQYIQSHDLCLHDSVERQIYEIAFKCPKQEKVTHQVPLKSAVCSECGTKIKQTFVANGQCAVCDGKQQQILENLEKYLSSPALNYFKSVIKALSNTNKPQLIKKQIELYCLSPKIDQKGQRYSYQQVASSQMSEEFRNSYQNHRQQHQSKRYLFYTKCLKHNKIPLIICNQCIVAMLNIQYCPFGCHEEKKVKKKVKQDIKIMEAGFLILFPQKNVHNQNYHLKMFVVRRIQQNKRLDRWQGQVRKIKPKNSTAQRLMHGFGLYSATAFVDNLTYLYCGGVHSLNGKARNISYLIQLSKDARQFTIQQTKPMIVPRASHSLVYDAQRSFVFCVGGFTGENCLKACEAFNLKSSQWIQMPPLLIERSKPSVLIYKNQLLVFGGLSSNPQFNNILGERYNFNKNVWQKLTFDGYECPFMTNFSATTIIPEFQNSDLFIFGGSNYECSTYYVQKLQLKQTSQGTTFNFKYTTNSQKINYPRNNAALGLMNYTSQVKGQKNEKILLIFGGCQQHENFLKVDAVRFRKRQNDLDLIFSYDDTINMGSYKFLLRENIQDEYEQMSQKLLTMGLFSEEKLKTQFKTHLIEKMWFEIGKTFVWVPLGL